MTERYSTANKWDRDSRDLLVSLDTKVQSILVELQDLKGNYSNRLLSLEGNAVSKVQVDKLEIDLKTDIDDKIQNAILSVQLKLWIALGGTALALITAFIGTFQGVKL